MVRHRRIVRFAQAVFSACLLIASVQAADRVKIQSGELEGAQEPGSGVRAFKGIPFAAPPVGPLRWKAPQPVASWTGVRKADEFGSRCMQGNPFGRHDFSRQGNQRGLFVPERVDPRGFCERAPSRHGLDLWRRIRGWRLLRTAAGRRESRQEGRGGGQLQLSPRRVRLLLASRSRQGVGSQRFGKLRFARPGGRARVGAEEHQCIWRRRAQSDHLRRIGGIFFRERAHGIAARAGPVSARHR